MTVEAPERGTSIPQRYLLGAAVVAATVVITFKALGISWLDAGVLGFILALMPVLSVAQVRLLGEVEVERIPVYLSSFVTLLVLGALCGVVGGWQGGPAALGLSALSVPAMAGWTLGLTGGGLGVLFAFRRIALVLGLSEAPIVEALIPRTPVERKAFAVLSVAAGVGEEIAYRGYGISLLAPLMGAGGAVALTSVVFGVLHAYQGAWGMVRAGLLGALLAWGFLASGSLWPAVLAHALLDILAGLFLADRLMVRREVDGVEVGV